MDGGYGAGPVTGEFDREKEAARKKSAAMEADRRSSLVEGMRGKSGGGNTLSSRRSSAVPLEEVVIPGQHFFLVNLAHHHLRPHSETPTVRVCGVFEDIESARAHAAVCKPLLPDSDFWLFGRGEHFLICTSKEEVADLEYRKRKSAELFRAHGVLDAAEREKKWNEERRKREPVTKEKIGKSTFAQRRKAGPSTKSSRIPAIRAKMLAECQERAAKKNFPSAGVVRNQNFVAMSYLHDVSEAVLAGEKSPEPLVILWACFPDVQQAKEWVDNEGSRSIQDMVIDVVDMYEFLPFELADESKIKVTYRHSEHNAIMAGQQEEEKKVERFRDHCNRSNITAPETVIDVAEKEFRDVVTGETSFRPVTTVQKSDKRPFEATARSARKGPILVPKDVLQTSDENSCSEEAARQILARQNRAWEEEGSAVAATRDYYPGDDDAESLRKQVEANPKTNLPFRPYVDPSRLRDPAPVFQDNVGLPGSMLVGQSDGGGAAYRPLEASTQRNAKPDAPRTRTVAPIGFGSDAPALFKRRPTDTKTPDQR